MIEIPHIKIRRFLYNDFYGQLRRGQSKYNITSFIEWTGDPGIGIFGCSDEKRRLIPTFAFMENWREIKDLIPEQDMTNKIYFWSILQIIKVKFMRNPIKKHWYQFHKCPFCSRLIWGNGFYNHLNFHYRRNPLIEKRKRLAW